MGFKDIQSSKDKKANYLFFVLALLIFSYTFIRADLLSITWDEAFSYLEFTRNGIVFIDRYDTMSANNHLLKTWLDIHLVHYFGLSELVLRLPSLFAHLLFLYYSFRLVKDFPNKVLSIAAFLIININPYLLDFFSLSRGYALSLGLMMASIYYLYAYINATKTLYVLLVCVLAALATFANFVMLNYFIVVSGWLLVLIARNSFQKNEQYKVSTALFSAALTIIILGFSLWIILPVVLKLKDAGALFYGGNKGFWTDTFSTITDRSFYEQGYNQWFQRIAKGLVILVIICSGIILAYRILKKEMTRHRIFLLSLLLLVCVCSLSTIIQHYVFGTLYLMDRTALFLVVMFNLLLAFLMNEFSLINKKAVIIACLFCTMLLFHFASAFNLRYVLEWKWDADIKEMITDLNKVKELPKRKDNISIGIPLEFDQGINFYRAKDNLTWLNTVERSDLSDNRYDYLFFGPDEVSETDLASLTIIKQFPVTNNLLVRRKYPVIYTEIAYSEIIDFGDSAEKQHFIHESAEYSKEISCTINERLVADKNAYVAFKATVMSRDISKDNLYIIVSFENAKGLLAWKRASVKDYIVKPRAWTQIYFAVLVPPETTVGDKLKAYIWNPNKHTLFVKKMELKWLTDQ